MDEPNPQEKIEALETELRILKDDKKALRLELSEATDLIDQMREHVEDSNAVIERWVEVFDMEKNEAGDWVWNPDQTKLWDTHRDQNRQLNNLMREWNKFVPEYNSAVSPRNVGRRLQASDAQVQEVRRLRKGGVSIRGIAKETALSLRTIRTILSRGTDRERSRTNELRRKSIDKLANADFKAKERGRQYLAKQISSTLKNGGELMKAAKGIGQGKR